MTELDLGVHSPEPMKSLRPHSPVLLAVIFLGALTGCGTPAGTAPILSPSPAVFLTSSPSVTPPVTPAGPPPVVTGTASAGPICPVERNPPDPSCAPRPVSGAVIVATDENGQEAGRATTSADGTFQLVLSKTGTFVITGLTVTGLMGLPDPVTVSLAFVSATAHLDLVYDTGIR